MASVTINNSPGGATLSNRSKITLFKGETLTITVGTGFPPGVNVDKVNFFNSVKGGKGANLQGSWKRDGTGVLAEGLTAATSGNGVAITDDATVDEDYYYEVWANGISADPELVAKKSRRPPSTPAPSPEAGA